MERPSGGSRPLALTATPVGQRPCTSLQAMQQVQLQRHRSQPLEGETP